jgi:hypothetical protein
MFILEVVGSVSVGLKKKFFGYGKLTVEYC